MGLETKQQFGYNQYSYDPSQQRQYGPFRKGKGLTGSNFTQFGPREPTLRKTQRLGKKYTRSLASKAINSLDKDYYTAAGAHRLAETNPRLRSVIGESPFKAASQAPGMMGPPESMAGRHARTFVGPHETNFQKAGRILKQDTRNIGGAFKKAGKYLGPAATAAFVGLDAYGLASEMDGTRSQKVIGGVTAAGLGIGAMTLAGKVGSSLMSGLGLAKMATPVGIAASVAVTAFAGSEDIMNSIVKPAFEEKNVKRYGSSPLKMNEMSMKAMNQSLALLGRDTSMSGKMMGSEAMYMHN